MFTKIQIHSKCDREQFYLFHTEWREEEEKKMRKIIKYFIERENFHKYNGKKDFKCRPSICVWSESEKKKYTSNLKLQFRRRFFQENIKILEFHIRRPPIKRLSAFLWKENHSGLLKKRHLDLFLWEDLVII